MEYKTYIDENPLDVIDKNLVKQHVLEVCRYQESFNNNLYSKFSCVVFSENKKQFAYYVFFKTRHPHYDKIVFQDVSYFIQKEFRLKYAREIFQLVEKVAKELNCDLMLTHCKTKSQSNFFKKMDFKLKDYLLTKDI